MVFTWQLTIVVVAIIVAIMVMFGLTEDPSLQKQLLGYLDTIVPFIVGTAAGGTVGWAKGRGYI